MRVRECTAHVCRTLGLVADSVRLELQAGMVPVTAAGNRWTLTAPPATVRELDASLPALARALGLDTDDLGERPLWVKAGTELPIRYQIAQGDRVGRPSTLHLDVGTARQIRVGGNVAEVARGVVTLDS